MAGPWHLPNASLRDELEQSRLHWTSGGRDGALFVAVNADLRQLDLAETTLAGAQLQGADLRGARLDHAILVRAELDGARLDGAHLFKADGDRASLAQAELVDVSARMSRWPRASMVRTVLRGADLTDADLRRAELIGADLTDAVLTRADLREALLGSACLDGADLTEARVESAVVAATAWLRARSASTSVGTPAWLGDPPVEAPRTRSYRGLIDRVRGVLDAMSSIRIHETGPAGGRPDLVVESSLGRYVALSVHPAPPQDWLDLVARRADAVVVERGRRGVAPGGAAIVGVDDLSDWLAWALPRTSALRGAVAIAVRQDERLRPYVELARRARLDPTFLSRLSVWLDAGRKDFPMPASERRLADRVPAHVDGASAARAARWADAHLEALTIYDEQVRKLWRRLSESDEELALELAERGLKFERDLGSAASGSERSERD